MYMQSTFYDIQPTILSYVTIILKQVVQTSNDKNQILAMSEIGVNNSFGNVCLTTNSNFTIRPVHPPSSPSHSSVMCLCRY